MPRSEILRSGIATGIEIDGAVLEAAIEWNDHTLLFATDDIPFEDSLRIYLFNPEFGLVDSASIGWMYSTGTFAKLDISQPNVVSFQFIGGTTWTLELLGTEAFVLPFFSDPRGVSRPCRLRRRFTISGKPLPEGRMR